MDKKELVENLLAVKEASGKTYDEIAEALDLCNIYVAQLFRAQAQLKKETAPKLAKLIPGITNDLLKEMQKRHGAKWVGGAGKQSKKELERMREMEEAKDEGTKKFLGRVSEW